MYDLITLANLRRDLVEALSTLRTMEEHFPVTRAAAEERIINAYSDPRAMGTNEADRKRTLINALSVNSDYLYAVSDLRAAQHEVDRLTAEVAIQEDQRRAQEWEIRGRLVDAMLAAEGQTLALTNNVRMTPEEIASLANVGE